MASVWRTSEIPGSRPYWIFQIEKSRLGISPNSPSENLELVERWRIRHFGSRAQAIWYANRGRRLVSVFRMQRTSLAPRRIVCQGVSFFLICTSRNTSLQNFIIGKHTKTSGVYTAHRVGTSKTNNFTCYN